MFYTMIFAFYSGAQTMFLTTSPKIPIENTREVLSSSQWELLTVKDYNTYIDMHASKGDDLYIKYKQDLEAGKTNSYKTFKVGKTLPSYNVFAFIFSLFLSGSLGGSLYNSQTYSSYLRTSFCQHFSNEISSHNGWRWISQPPRNKVA